MNTFILKWNPEISSFKYDDYLKLLNNPDEMDLNWSIHDWKLMHEGDRVFFLRVGKKPQLLASGYVYSEPYMDEDWSGRGRQVYYADMSFDFACHPDYAPVLTAEDMEKQIPDFDWRTGHSGVMLNRQQSEKLEVIWLDFLYEHRDDFVEFNPYVIDYEPIVDETPDDGGDEDDAEPPVGIIAEGEQSFAEIFGCSEQAREYHILQEYLYKLRGESCQICGYNYQKIFGDKCKTRPAYIYIDQEGEAGWKDSFVCVCPSCEKVLREEDKVFKNKKR